MPHGVIIFHFSFTKMQFSMEIVFLVHLFSAILQDHKYLGYRSGLIYFTCP